MKLDTFLPYRLAVVAEAVSRSLAQVYGTRFDLSRDEWRVLAALAEAGELRSSALAARTTLDKMQVSRALARLARDGLVARDADPDDRRTMRVRLRPAGRQLVRRIVPMVRAREAFLLEALAPAERAALERALETLLERAQRLQRAG